MLKVFLLSNKRKRSPGSRPREISRTSIFVALEDTTFFTYLFIYLHNFYQFHLIIYLFIYLSLGRFVNTEVQLGPMISLDKKSVVIVRWWHKEASQSVTE